VIIRQQVRGPGDHFGPRASLVGGRKVTPEFSEIISQLGMDDSILQQFLSVFAIDTSLMDDEVASPPSVHRDSTVGLLLRLSQTTDAKSTKKMIGMAGAMIKMSSGLKRRMQDEECKLWTPAVTMINTPASLNKLNDEQLRDVILATKAQVQSLPETVKNLVFNYFI
jgi:hypothetical protein